MGKKRLSPSIERCPECGSSRVEPRSNVRRNWVGTFETISQVWCKKCGANGPAVWGWEANLEGRHIELWNSWAKWKLEADRLKKKAWELQGAAYKEWKIKEKNLERTMHGENNS